MTDRDEAENGQQDRQPAPQRRPWHAPQFVSTDIAETYTQGNGGSDGGPMGSQS